MFYMRPSRYFPNHTPTKTIIDNLCYVMNTMLHKNPFAQREGIGFVACMDHWTMKNFEVPYCYQFMLALQGFMVPVKTQLFLIVNPPSWFGAVWKIMKPMLAPSFRKRVKICPESKIAKYLAPGYQKYLPDDMRTGQANTDALVVDYIAYRQYIEQGQVHHGIRHPNNNPQQNSFSNPSSQQDSSYSNLSSSGGVVDDISSHCSSQTSSNNPGRSRNSGSTHTDPFWEYDDDSDGASIGCDIDNEEALLEEEAKQQASTIHIANMPRLR